MSVNSIVFIFLSYLVGSLSFAIIASRALGLADPRSFGSKNPGATNMLRSGKKWAALITLAGDAAKGWVMVFFAQKLQLPELAVALAALAVFLGHLYPIYFGFKGGKGVATALGIISAFSLVVGLAVALSWLLVYGLFRISSLSALVAAGLAPFYAGLALPPVYSLTVLGIALLVVGRHHSNIKNLIKGEER